jgi:hypothetical protein
LGKAWTGLLFRAEAARGGFACPFDIKALETTETGSPNIFQAFIWNFLGRDERYQGVRAGNIWNAIFTSSVCVTTPSLRAERSNPEVVTSLDRARRLGCFSRQMRSICPGSARNDGKHATEKAECPEIVSLKQKQNAPHSVRAALPSACSPSRSSRLRRSRRLGECKSIRRAPRTLTAPRVDGRWPASPFGERTRPVGRSAHQKDL